MNDSVNNGNGITDTDNSSDNVNSNVAYSSNSLENDLTPEEERMRMDEEGYPKFTATEGLIEGPYGEP